MKIRKMMVGVAINNKTANRSHFIVVIINTMSVILTYYIVANGSVGVWIPILGSRLSSLGRREITTSILGSMVYIGGA